MKINKTLPVYDKTNPLYEEMDEILLDIWSKGIIVADNKLIAMSFFLNILMGVVTDLIFIIPKKIIEIIVLLVCWFFVKPEMPENYITLFNSIFLILAIVLFRKELYEYICLLFLSLIEIFSFGHFSKWLGRNYSIGGITRLAIKKWVLTS